MTDTTQSQNDVSHIWTRVYTGWLKTGLLSGLGAGLVALVFGAFLANLIHREATYPAKLIGAVWVGAEALQLGSFNSGALAGLVIHFTLSAFFGLVFAQFISERSRKGSLVFLSLLGGVAVWLFWSMMFLPSFNPTMASLLPKTISLLLHFVFGLSFGLFIVMLRPMLCKLR